MSEPGKDTPRSTEHTLETPDLPARLARIRATVNVIANVLGNERDLLYDPRGALQLEYDLYCGVLAAIAADPTDAALLAREALRSRDIPFSRMLA